MKTIKESLEACAPRLFFVGFTRAFGVDAGENTGPVFCSQISVLVGQILLKVLKRGVGTIIEKLEK